MKIYFVYPLTLNEVRIVFDSIIINNTVDPSAFTLTLSKNLTTYDATSVTMGRTYVDVAFEGEFVDENLDFVTYNPDMTENKICKKIN